jgi:hypothetical protein
MDIFAVFFDPTLAKKFHLHFRRVGGDSSSLGNCEKNLPISKGPQDRESGRERVNPFRN